MEAKRSRGLCVEGGRPVASNQQPSPDPDWEGYFEPIGAGAGPMSGPVMENDAAARRRAPIVRTAVIAGACRWVAGLGSIRFWATALGVLCATWAGVAGLVIVAGQVGNSTEWLASSVLTYLLACSLLPAASAVVATHWGISSYQLSPPRGRAGVGVLAAAVAAGLQGSVLALLILVTLLVAAGAAGQSGSLAAVSAFVAAAEGFIFGSVGAAVAGIGRHSVLKRFLGLALALFLVAGTVAAGVALAPATRGDEPVTVALNVEHAPDGTSVSYQCSSVSAGLREVYHTDRIMWLPAASPSVLFVMLAGQSDGRGGPLEWLSRTLQEAADGTAVPCVNGEPRSRDALRVPLAAVGLLVQMGIAAGLIGWAYAVSGRRAEPASSDSASS